MHIAQAAPPAPPLANIPNTLTELNHHDFKTYITPLVNRHWSISSIHVGTNGISTSTGRGFSFKTSEAALEFAKAAANLAVKETLSSALVQSTW